MTFFELSEKSTSFGSTKFSLVDSLNHSQAIDF